MRQDKGFAIITVVVAVSLISAVILGVILFTSLSQMKQTKHYEKVELARYAYEAGMRMAVWEIAYNPAVHDTIDNGGKYTLNTISINGLKVNVTIKDDSDGDGQFDITVNVHE